MQIILTPKNIYRVLSGRLMGDTDFLPGDQKRGLIQFYRAVLNEAVSPEVLQRIFPEEGPRPRIQSDLMNRSSSTSLPRFLREEFERKPPIPTMSRNLAGLLGGLVYQAETLFHTISTFEDACFQQDFFITPQIREFLVSLRRHQQINSYTHLVLQCAYRLACLIVFSFYGSQMNDSTLARQCFVANLDKTLEEMCGVVPARWQIITSADTLSACSPMPKEKYVTLSVTPEMVVYRLQRDHRLLISGMGGSGKTELVRQALSLVTAYRNVAFVQVEGSLVESFRAAFPGIEEKKDGAFFEAVRAKMEEAPSLLVLDQAGNDVDFSELSNWRCDLLVTDRRAELPGFSVLHLESLDLDASERLLRLSAGLPLEKQPVKSAETLYRFTGGHPLTLSILGALCRTNYWTEQQLAERLVSQGFQSMTLTGEEAGQSLPVYMNHLLRLAELDEQDTRLLRFIAMFPMRAWKPDELIDLTTAERLLSLAEKSLLKRGEHGYLMHPVLAETFRAKPYSADEFPEYWRRCATFLDSPSEPDTLRTAELATAALLRCDTRLNQDALLTLTSIERKAMTFGAVLLKHDLPGLHQRWLDSHPHTAEDEINLHVIRMLWALLGNKEDYAASANALLNYPKEALLSHPRYELLLNVLEIGGSRISRDLLDGLFDLLQPDENNPDQLVMYLNFLGGKLRTLDKQPELALQTLAKARPFIQPGSVKDAANNTRTAYCLADLGRWQETLPLMRRTLEIFRARGYAEDSQTVVSTRNAYQFFLGKCTDLQRAMDELQTSIEAMRREGKQGSYDYVCALQHYTDLLTESGDYEQAETVIREALGLLPEEITLYPTTLTMAGKIFLHNGKLLEALGAATLSVNLREKHYGPDSETAKKAQELRASILKCIMH